MNFIASVGSFTGGRCSGGATRGAVATLEQFFFPGSVQKKKEQSAPHPCSSKRQRAACAAVAAARTGATKKICAQSSQLRITDCFSLSTVCSCSPTQRQSAHEEADATLSSSKCTGREGAVQKIDNSRTKKATEAPHNDALCGSSGFLKEIQRRETACEEVIEKNDTVKLGNIRSVSESEEASSPVPGSEESGLGANATASAAARALECVDGLTETSSAEILSRRRESLTRSPSPSPAAARGGTNASAPKERTSRKRPETEAAPGSVSVGVQNHQEKRSSLSIESAAASAGLGVQAKAAVISRRTSTTAEEGAYTITPSASETVAVTTKETLYVTATAATSAAAASSLAVKCTSSLGKIRGANAVFSRISNALTSSSALPLLDPEGKPLADEAQREQRWRDALGNSWFEELRQELALPYFLQCLSFVRTERQKHRVFPPAHLLFNAFRTTPLDKIKVVIVGQDPYHQPGQAMGLAFSVPKGIPVPPSLQNIFKEIGRNYPSPEKIDSTAKSLKAQHGDLTDWAEQGVFLMNTVLTVRENSPLSHRTAGWERFTDKVVNIINTRCDGVVFLLWGKPAQKKSSTLDRQRHLILEAGHPSPLSVRFFEGCQHFTKCNEYLSSKGKTQIVFNRRA